MKNITFDVKENEGFTLVELSIVLVIIGLIVGGVLVGQDMIKSAEIRSTIAQVQGYDTAVNVFKDKYSQLPGDISSTQATTLGLTTRTGAAGRGDGSGLITALPANPTYLGHETALFWRDLSQLNVISNSFNAATDALATLATADAVKTMLPEAKLKRGNFITVYSSSGKNYYEITGVSAVAAGVYTLTTNLSPQEAMNLDTKLDDGLPLTGAARAAYSTSALDGIQASNNTVAAAYVAASFTGCVNSDATAGTATDPYQVGTEDYANTLACQLRIQAGF